MAHGWFMFSIIIASAAVATTTAASSSECNYKGVSSKRRRQPPRPRPLQANNYLLAYLFMVLLIIEQRRKKTKKKLCPLPQLSSPPLLPLSSVSHFGPFSARNVDRMLCAKEQQQQQQPWCKSSAHKPFHLWQTPPPFQFIMFACKLN